MPIHLIDLSEQELDLCEESLSMDLVSCLS